MKYCRYSENSRCSRQISTLPADCLSMSGILRSCDVPIISQSATVAFPEWPPSSRRPLKNVFCRRFASDVLYLMSHGWTMPSGRDLRTHGGPELQLTKIVP